jgi:peptidyl-prolyl cis-trans isomerase SurA
MNIKQTIIRLTIHTSIAILATQSNIIIAKNKEQQQSPEPLDQVVAIVNENVITDSELKRQVGKIIKQLKYSNEQLPPVQDLKKQVLNTMIIDDLQLQLAKNNNITATPEQINTALDNIAKQNNVNIFDLKTLIEKDGINFNEFKEDLTNQLTIMNVQNAAVRSDIKISKQELNEAKKVLNTQNSNNKYRLSHILISVPDEPNSEKIQYAKQKAHEIIEQLNNGKSFSSVAKVTSDGQQALNGGDLGWFTISELPSIFTEITPTLTIGQIHGPIQSENGFHIIKLTDAKYDSKKYQETKYKVRHILIKKDNITNSSIAEIELNRIKKEIHKNNNFADLALIYSDDPVSASRGGDLGWINKYEVVPEFASIMTSLKVNQISEPFESSFGWHIVQLEDIKQFDNTDKWQDKQATQLLEQKKFQDALANWQNKIRTQAHVKILI